MTRVRVRLWHVLSVGVLVAAGAAVQTIGATSSTTSAADPTFATDVAPIIYANCTTCHRPGQSAPFALISYDDVRRRGRTIVDVTARRYMPPWHALHAEGFAEFRDERRLSDAQLSTLKAWVDGGMPSGDLTKAPKVPDFPIGWALGEPDRVVQFPRAVDVPADGPDLYRNITIPIDLPDDQWITAIDLQPTARRVVHHALYFVGPAGAVVSDTDALPGLGGIAAGLGRGQRASGAGGARGGAAGAADEAWGGLGGWVPGVTPRFFPEGIAQAFPKHSNLVIQLHLHPNGKAEREEGKIALYFAKKAPEHSLTGVQVPPVFGFGMGIDIPAGEKRYTIKDSFTLPVDVEAFGVRGHAHYLAREMKMTAKLPNGSTQGLLLIRDWDFGWQDSYYYKAPIKLPAGSTIDVEIAYDNTDNNPRNPHSPPVRVRWGRESFDEMGSMTLLVAAPAGSGNETLRTAQTQHFRLQLLQRLTRRGGGGLD